MFPLRDAQEAKIFPLITYAIIAINAIVFFLEVTAVDADAFIETYALIPASVNFSNYLTLTPFITSQFLHAGFLHIISNMWFLKIFGDNVEEKFGHIPYLFIYLLTGTVGIFIQYLIVSESAIPMLGASAAVAGVLGAYLVFFPHHRIETLVPLGFFITTLNIPASVMLFYWFITQLFSGVGSIAIAQTGGVAFWAHVGGFVSGWVIAKLYSGNIANTGYEEGEIIG
jgi:membrane associated rhomboid family serine protease